MGKMLNWINWSLGLGSEPQNFLGARWIPPFLKKVPEKSKRKWALRFLILSPHYFISRDYPQFKNMSTDEYVEAAFRESVESRVNLYDKLFKDYLHASDTVLEYGCGAGFLAKAAASHVEKICACDISGGAIACADIINKAENIQYLTADEKGLSEIKDESLDAVFSFAVTQHLTDEAFEVVLENSHRKLKPDGRLIFHIQLEDEIWKTEDYWKSDNSLKGKIKFKYGLHCFGRTLEKHKEIVEKHGFSSLEFKSLKYLGNPNSSDADSQYLLTAEKVSGKIFKDYGIDK